MPNSELKDGVLATMRNHDAFAEALKSVKDRKDRINPAMDKP